MSPRTKLAVLAIPAALLVAACSSPPARTPAAQVPKASAAAQATSAAPAVSTTAPSSADLSGTWSGKYGGSFKGTFTLTWSQSGSNLSGTIKISTPVSTMNIKGTVVGDSIRFGTVGSYGIVYSGKVSGDSMSGSYQVKNGTGDGGPWSATKSS